MTLQPQNGGAWRRAGAVAFSLALSACAGSRDSRLPTQENASREVQRLSARPGSIRGKLLFEDAAKAFENQKKSKIYDYPYLERKFAAVLAEDSSLAEADYNLGVIAEHQGNPDAARAHYHAALKKKPSLKEAAENLAVLAQNAGNTQDAILAYNSVLSTHPDDARVRTRLADIYRQSGDCEQGLQLSRQALLREPRMIEAYRVMMLCYLARKQHSMAKLVGLRGLKIDERDPELHHTLGLVFLQEREPAKARIEFKSAIDAQADYLPSRAALAKMAMDEGNYRGAEGHLQRILKIEPGSAEAHLNLGVAYKGMAQFDKAMLEYDAAEKLNPELPEIYLDRGIILHRHKDAPERAVVSYKKYISLAGGEAALPSNAPVFALMQEAEQISQVKMEAKHAEEQALVLKAAQRAQQQDARSQEKQQQAPGSSIKDSEPPEAPGKNQPKEKPRK